MSLWLGGRLAAAGLDEAASLVDTMTAEERLMAWRRLKET